MSMYLLVRELATHLGAEPPGQQPVYEFTLNDTQVIRMEEDTTNNRFAVATDVAPMGSDIEKQVTRKVLAANFFGNGTDQSVLALDDDRDTLVLFRWYPTSQAALAPFLKDLSVFLSVAEHWREKVAPSDAPGESRAIQDFGRRV